MTFSIIRTSHGLFLISILAVLGCMACDSSPGDTPTCKSLQAEATKQLAAVDTEMVDLRKQVAAAIEKSPKAGATPCGVEGLNPRQYQVVSPRSVASMKEPGTLGFLRDFDRQAKDCKFELLETQKKLLGELNEAVASHDAAHSIFFAEGERKEPKLIDAKTYEPGRLTGRVFLWSHGEGRIACYAESESVSSKKLTTLTGGPGSTQDSLNNHLTFLTVKAGVEKLRKVEK